MRINMRRDQYIDWCRSLAFILVILQHSGVGKLGNYILGFHMPAFLSLQELHSV